MNEIGVGLPSQAQRLRDNHSIEWAYRWQYAATFRVLRDLEPAQFEAQFAKAPAELLVPPEGEGWEINVDYAKSGYYARIPAWSMDSRALHQVVHWRRYSPQMEWTSPDRKIFINRDTE